MESHTIYRYIELIIMAVNNYQENLPLNQTEEDIINMLEEYNYIFEEYLNKDSQKIVMEK